jgi:glycosyltransferase involved in cell wall biosynthesis
MGGLGNQLFQIFTTIAIAMREKHRFIFLDKKILDSSENVTIRNTYWDSFLSGLKIFTKEIYPSEPITLREKGFQYQNISIPNNNQNELFMLYGYFQSYKYFNDYNDMIINKLIKMDLIKEKLLKKYDIIDFNQTISMHFRIGDYKNLQHMHPIMKYNYYENSLNYIKNVKKSQCKNVLYFCEEKDLEDVLKIVNNLKKEFPDLEFQCVNFEICDWEQMILMSLCKNNIIANSTYSWWGAYFNTNTEKIICYPEIWFGKASTHNISDLFLPEWKKIDC